MKDVINNIKSEIEELETFLRNPAITAWSYVITRDGTFYSPESTFTDKGEQILKDANILVHTNPLRATRYTPEDAPIVAANIKNGNGPCEAKGIHQAVTEKLAEHKEALDFFINL